MSDTLEEAFAAHAPLSPSSADGWSTCADYINANRGLPDRSSEAACEGTAAHAIRDLCLHTGLSAYDFIGMVTKIGEFTFVWEEVDAELLQPGIDRLLAEAANGEFFGEHRVDTSAYTLPGQFGTLDGAVITEELIIIDDEKWGRAVPVTPVRCKQLMLYALSFWQQIARHRTKATRFQIRIDQPRHGGGGGSWFITLDELLAFGDWIRERAAATQGENLPRTASLTGCRWCRRRRAPGGCDTFDTYMVELLGLTWDDIDMGIMMSDEMTPPRELTADRRSWLLLHKGTIVRWLDQLEEEALEDAEQARPTGLMKAVKGNKLPDKWLNKGLEATPLVESLIGEKGFNKRLKTPKQIVTAVAEDEDAMKAILPFIEHGEKKTVLVPLEDARPAIRTGADFDAITEEGTE